MTLVPDAIPSSPTPEYIGAIPENLRRRLGRTIRVIVDKELRYGDGSGEATAREAFDALADALDPEHGGITHDTEVLLDEAQHRATPVAMRIRGRT